MRTITNVALLLLPFIISGCGLIFGGSQEVDNKSHSYTVVRLDREKDWSALKAEQGDTAFENKQDNTIISLNSVCREYRETSLKALSKNLLMGLNNTSPVTQRDLKVDEVPALESTVETLSAEEQPLKVRAIVLRKSGCTFDLMYIAKPQSFEKHRTTFERFVKGFHAN